MALGRKDLLATLFTALAVLVFFATHQGWNVWLVGDSHRWAAGAIVLLGAFGCMLGEPGRDPASRWLALLGVLALVFAVFALVSGSLTPLSLLVVDTVLLWGVATARHLGAFAHGHPVT